MTRTPRNTTCHMFRTVKDQFTIFAPKASR
jgi:hypothetical protein